MREDRRGALPWLSLVRCFALLSAVLWQEMARLRSSHLVDDMVRCHKRLLLGRYGPLSGWSPLLPDLAEQLADLQARLLFNVICPEAIGSKIIMLSIDHSPFPHTPKCNLPRSHIGSNIILRSTAYGRPLLD